MVGRADYSIVKNFLLHPSRTFRIKLRLALTSQNATGTVNSHKSRPDRDFPPTRIRTQESPLLPRHCIATRAHAPHIHGDKKDENEMVWVDAGVGSSFSSRCYPSSSLRIHTEFFFFRPSFSQPASQPAILVLPLHSPIAVDMLPAHDLSTVINLIRSRKGSNRRMLTGPGCKKLSHTSATHYGRSSFCSNPPTESATLM